MAPLESLHQMKKLSSRAGTRACSRGTTPLVRLGRTPRRQDNGCQPDGATLRGYRDASVAARLHPHGSRASSAPGPPARTTRRLSGARLSRTTPRHCLLAIVPSLPCPPDPRQTNVLFRVLASSGQRGSRRLSLAYPSSQRCAFHHWFPCPVGLTPRTRWCTNVGNTRQ